MTLAMPWLTLKLLLRWDSGRKVDTLPKHTHKPTRDSPTDSHTPDSLTPVKPSLDNNPTLDNPIQGNPTLDSPTLDRWEDLVL